MWKKAEDIPKQDSDEILQRFDQTAPDVQRMIVLQWALDHIYVVRDNSSICKKCGLDMMDRIHFRNG